MDHWEDLRRRMQFMLRELHLQNRNPTGYILEISVEKLADVMADMDPTSRWRVDVGNGRTILGFSYRITGSGNRIALVHEVIG